MCRTQIGSDPFDPIVRLCDFTPLLIIHAVIKSAAHCGACDAMCSLERLSHYRYAEATCYEMTRRPAARMQKHRCDATRATRWESLYTIWQYSTEYNSYFTISLHFCTLRTARRGEHYTDHRVGHCRRDALPATRRQRMLKATPLPLPLHSLYRTSASALHTHPLPVARCTPARREAGREAQSYSTAQRSAVRVHSVQ